MLRYTRLLSGFMFLAGIMVIMPAVAGPIPDIKLTILGNNDEALYVKKQKDGEYRATVDTKSTKEKERNATYLVDFLARYKSSPPVIELQDEQLLLSKKLFTIFSTGVPKRLNSQIEG